MTTNSFDYLLNVIKDKSEKQYDLNDYNCANFALDAFNSISILPISSQPMSVIFYSPVTFSGTGFLFGQNPAGLYESLTNLKNSGSILAPNIQLGGVNYAPTSKGECN